MKKTTAIAAALFVLTIIGGQVLPACAEESAAPAESKKNEAKAPEEESKEGGKSKKSSDVSGGRFAGDPVYVHLSPIVLPILGNTGSEQLVTIQITVEVSDFDIADDMHTNMPRVMDALIRSLYGGLDSGTLRNGRLVDANKIKSKAMTAVQSIEGASNIRDVLIVNMSQRLL